MSHCGQCTDNCKNCSGCTASIMLNPGELAMLQKLAQIPFLPVARKADSDEPIYLEDNESSPQEYSLILQCMEKKGLIRLDYDLPIKGESYSAYGEYPVRGSFALTERGQQVLDILEIQGVQ